jgi:hypothetical protein
MRTLKFKGIFKPDKQSDDLINLFAQHNLLKKDPIVSDDKKSITFQFTKQRYLSWVQTLTTDIFETVETSKRNYKIKKSTENTNDDPTKLLPSFLKVNKVESINGRLDDIIGVNDVERTTTFDDTETNNTLPLKSQATSIVGGGGGGGGGGGVREEVGSNSAGTGVLISPHAMEAFIYAGGSLKGLGHLISTETNAQTAKLFNNCHKQLKGLESIIYTHALEKVQQDNEIRLLESSWSKEIYKVHKTIQGYSPPHTLLKKRSSSLAQHLNDTKVRKKVHTNPRCEEREEEEEEEEGKECTTTSNLPLSDTKKKPIKKKEKKKKSSQEEEEEEDKEAISNELKINENIERFKKGNQEFIEQLKNSNVGGILSKKVLDKFNSECKDIDLMQFIVLASNGMEMTKIRKRMNEVCSIERARFVYKHTSAHFGELIKAYKATQKGHRLAK